MRTPRTLRFRRRSRPTKVDGTFFKKESGETFFSSGVDHGAYFHPSAPLHLQPVIHKKCDQCEQEEKVQKQPDEKQEEKVMKAGDPKEEEKLQKAGDKKEEEKLMKAEDKKEEEKVMKAEDKKEEEKVMKAEEKKEEEKVMKTEAKKEELSKKESTSHPGAPSSVVNYASTLGNKGNNLPTDVNTFYSSRMHYDFSDVKIHTDKEAAESARDARAKAYAIGNHVVFNEGQYNMESSDGRKLMAHELTHVMQQRGEAVSQKLNRQVAPPPAPAPAPAPQFRDCVPAVTGVDNSNEVLNRAMNLAREFVTTAIDLLANAPVAGTVYADALALHFGTPISAPARARLLRVYRRILANLALENFICNRRACPDGHTQAFWLPSDDLLHVCRPFWALNNNTCEAVVLIHEAAHDAGIDLDDPAAPVEVPHSANRGQRGYPVAGGRARRVSRSARANTPDAYAFFAAHVHNGADTPGNCFR